MEPVYEIYQHPEKGIRVLKRGFSWPGFFFWWVWALAHRLWLPFIGLLGAFAGLVSVGVGIGLAEWMFLGGLWLAGSICFGAKAYMWRIAGFERQGFEYKGALRANDAPRAKSRAAMAAPFDDTLKNRGWSLSIQIGPPSVRRVSAMAFLTVRAAFRYRLVLVLTALLMLAVVVLPVMIKHDGTASGFTQILLTYTLGAMIALLGMATIWLGCGTLARDVEECQMQVVAVKPVARWQIWLGKWLGIMIVNAMLIGAAGGTVYALVLWRAKQLPPEQQEILRKQVLVGRGSMKEPVQDLWPTVDLQYQQLLKERPEVARMDREEVRQNLYKQLRTEEQVVRPDFRRRWMFDLDDLGPDGRNMHVRLRVKFQSSLPTTDDIWKCIWYVGPPDSSTKKPRVYQMQVQSGAFHEFDVDGSLADADGRLTIEYWNYNDRPMLFTLEEGMELLYPECGFGLNFTRGMGIIYLWMGLLAAIGLAAGSYLTFPVAAFVSMSVLIVGMCSGVMAEVIKDGTIYRVNHETGEAIKKPIDSVMVPLFRVLLKVINLVQDYSPVDSLSTGRSVTWKQLGMAFTTINLVMTGAFAMVGIGLFYRRELAAAQLHQ